MKKIQTFLIIFSFLIFQNLYASEEQEEQKEKGVSQQQTPTKPKNVVDELGGIMGNLSISAPSTPEKKEQVLKIPQSEPKKSTLYKFDLNLTRYLEKKKAGAYFSKAATLKCGEVVVSYLDDLEIFGENSFLKTMDDFLVQQVKASGTDGWKRNHLAANLFAVVYDAQKEQQRRIEGSLLAEATNIEDSLFYDFSISPGNKGLNGRKIADFVSSQVSEENVFNLINDKGYVPIYQSTLRPIVDKDNHGDRLALDTVSTNIDLFFNLIRKTAHREDLPIIAMGIRYYSSYDSCNPCFQKIYDMRNAINNDLIYFAKNQKYKIQNNEENFPFYSLFYSTRPYRDSSYSIYFKDPRDEKGYYFPSVKSSYTFPYGGISYHPTYYFDLPQLGKSDNILFSKRDSKQLSLLRGEHDLNPNFIYSYVTSFEPKGIPISYR